MCVCRGAYVLVSKEAGQGLSAGSGAARAGDAARAGEAVRLPGALKGEPG